MDSYTHLTQDGRYQIYGLLKSGMSLRQAARENGRHPSTVSCELRRNGGGRGYRPKQAHEKAWTRCKTAAKHVKMTPGLIRRLEGLLRQKWSPEQVSGRLKREGISISHEAIYQHVLKDKKAGGELYVHLRWQKRGGRGTGRNPTTGGGRSKTGWG